MKSLNTTIGNRDLSAWKPVPGIVWVQSRSAEYTARLAKRRDGQVVATGVAGGYLRTFEFHRSLAWAAELISRYTSNETSANA
jgi:hypothetical protein